MGSYRFSMAPNISVPRSKFKMPFNHVTAFNHGKLVPIDCFEILPGDEFKLDLSAVIRMSTPIAPIFGNIKAHVHVFFVPMRLVWDKTKEFYGENKTSAGYQQGTYKIPTDGYGYDGHYGGIGSVSNYLGKPLPNTSLWDSGNVEYVSILKERGYYLIWNEYYRAQQLQNPVLLQVGNAGFGTYTHGSDDNLAGTNTNIDFGTNCFNVCKEFDYFTACTTAPQYGSAVTLPLGTYAPVIGMNSGNNAQVANQAVTLKNTSAITSGNGNTYNVGIYASGGSTNYGSFVADLSNATAASINTIRYAFQVQKWLERANFGSRFFEMLNLHYGVTSPDARLQRPEYLGGKDFYINIDQVLSTAGYAASSSQEVGQVGAVSVTGAKLGNIFHKAFVEPGYVYVLISTTHERSYSQGFLREDLRQDRFDFYFPEFANLGDQAVYAKEIVAQCDSGTTPALKGTIFGYQEHWAEYRYRSDRTSNIMDPVYQNGLSFWNLGENFTSVPTLSNAFIMETRGDLTRCLVSGATGPDYIADFYFDYTAIREMPLYTIPGLVDHFGTM